MHDTNASIPFTVFYFLWMTNTISLPCTVTRNLLRMRRLDSPLLDSRLSRSCFDFLNSRLQLPCSRLQRPDPWGTAWVSSTWASSRQFGLLWGVTNYFETTQTSLRQLRLFRGCCHLLAFFQTNDVRLGGGGGVGACSFENKIGIARGRASSRSIAIELRDRRSFVIMPADSTDKCARQCISRAPIDLRHRYLRTVSGVHLNPATTLDDFCSYKAYTLLLRTRQRKRWEKL